MALSVLAPIQWHCLYWHLSRGTVYTGTYPVALSVLAPIRWHCLYWHLSRGTVYTGTYPVALSILAPIQRHCLYWHLSSGTVYTGTYPVALSVLTPTQWHCLYWHLSSGTACISANASSVRRMQLPVNFRTGRVSVRTALLRLSYFSISTAILVRRTRPRTAEENFDKNESM